MIVAGPDGFMKNEYRKFNIQSEDITPGDDFGMMREVLTRRFKRLAKEAPPARDLFFGYEPKLGTAMRRGDWKMILKDGAAQLYHLKDDRKETRDLSLEKPDVAAAMRSAIEEFKRTVTPGS